MQPSKNKRFIKTDFMNKIIP